MIDYEKLIDAQIEYWTKLKFEFIQSKFKGEIKGFNHIVEPNEKVCVHEYKKTLAKSGMYFIDMCHKCGDQQAFYPECQHEPDSQKHLFSDEGGNFFMNKCKKCGNFYK